MDILQLSTFTSLLSGEYPAIELLSSVNSTIAPSLLSPPCRAQLSTNRSLRTPELDWLFSTEFFFITITLGNVGIPIQDFALSQPIRSQSEFHFRFSVGWLNTCLLGYFVNWLFIRLVNYFVDYVIAAMARSVWCLDYRTDYRRIGFWFPSGAKVFLFSTASRPALGSTHWIELRRVSAPSIKLPEREADRSLPSSAKELYLQSSICLYVFMWWLIKRRDNFTFRYFHFFSQY
jgi:hypothetical protein